MSTCSEYLIDQGLFSLDEFNHKLSTFEFTYSDAGSKPEPLKRSVFITGERKLKYSAENARIFLKVLPFILEHFVDTEDDVFYQFLIELSSITTMLYDVVISGGTRGYLASVIKNHLENFKSLFVESNPIPKHHYLLEFPDLILQFGPPVRYCCMRFEALHKVFKSFVSVVNFQHLCSSLTNKYLLSISEGTDEHEHCILKSSRVDGPTRTLKATEIEVLKGKFVNFPNENHVYSLNWIIYNGTKFVVNRCLVAVSVDKETHLPVFGKLKQIILCGERIMFVTDLFHAQQFQFNFNGYIVNNDNDDEIYFIDEILDYNIYQVVQTLDGSLIVPLKYDLLDLIEEHLNNCNPLHE